MSKIGTHTGERARRYPDESARPTMLATLLQRRAVAAEAGFDDLEATLRSQILDILPTRIGSADGDRPVIREPNATAGAATASVASARRTGGTEAIKRGWLTALPTVNAGAPVALPIENDQRAEPLFVLGGATEAFATPS